MEDKNFDVIVIGGGPAGYIAAIKASQLGGRVALIEKDVLGGTCLNRGCIPTKAYLKSAEIIHGIRKANKRGINISNPEISIDMAVAVKNKNKAVKKLTSGVGMLLKSNNVVVYKGTGILSGPGKVTIDNKDILSGKSVILAGGSEAVKLNIPGINAKGVLTSDQILDIEEVPESLLIIGGGVIGVEMGMIFSSFGSRVTIVELDNKILPFMDKDVSSAIEASLKQQGVEIITAKSVKKMNEVPSGVQVELNDNSKAEYSKVLLSIGRKADLSCIGNQPLLIEKGKIVVNEYMETSMPGVYAPGDINGKKMLAHSAFKMGEYAAVHALEGKKPEFDALRYVPSVVYTIPEAAGVGLTEDEAFKRGNISIGNFPLSANGKALVSDAAEGFVKVIADPVYGEILGVHIVGAGASEIINEAASLMSMEITVNELAEIIHGHPSVSEALMEAAADCLGHCMHLPPRRI